MARHNVTKVFDAWLDRKACSGGTNSSGNRTIWTDGQVIYSYNMPVVVRTFGRIWVAKADPGAYTKTTAQHRNGLAWLVKEHHLEMMNIIHEVAAEHVKQAAEGGDALEEVIALVVDKVEAPSVRFAA